MKNFLLNKFRFKRSRGVSSIETAFVFNGIILFTVLGINLASYMHTRFMATYAGFMATRSYQVYGDQTGREAFQETVFSGEQELLSELPALATIQTAEDIFTCGLPWVRPPQDDVIGSGADDRAGCMSNQRQYQSTNINRSFAFVSFENPELAERNQAGNFLPIEDGYAENGRFPARYAILKLQYKNNLILNPYNVFDGDTTDGRNVSDFDRRRLWSRVYIPVSIEPGLETGVSRAEPDSDATNDVDESVSEEEAEDENN